MIEYGRIHTDGSRSGGQPVLKPCPFCGGEAEVERSGTNRRSHIIACTDCGCRLETGETWNAGSAWNTRQPTQSDALLDAEGVKLYWYRQGKDDGVEHERAKIVAWLRDGFVRDWGQLWRNQLINAIEAGEHLKEQSK